jgi:hypothetical protein
MLVDDLRASPSHKLDHEFVKRFDLALEPDPAHEKHSHFNPMVAEMR